MVLIFVSLELHNLEISFKILNDVGVGMWSIFRNTRPVSSTNKYKTPHVCVVFCIDIINLKVYNFISSIREFKVCTFIFLLE